MEINVTKSLLSGQSSNESFGPTLSYDIAYCFGTLDQTFDSFLKRPQMPISLLE